MATYKCAVCGALALNTNSLVTDGQIIHRACATPAPTDKPLEETAREATS